MVEPHMVRDKVEHQANTSFVQSIAKLLESLGSTDWFANAIVRDGESRTADVLRL